MALTRTLLQLRTSLRNRADHLVGTFRADTVLNGYLSESCRSLVSMLVDEYEEMYWAKSATVATVSGTQTSAQPTDLWKFIAMRVTINGIRDRVQKADLDEIDVEGTQLNGWASGEWPRHRLVGRTIYWAPIPRAVHTVTIYYVPIGIMLTSADAPLSEFATDTDKFDGMFGWDTWVVLDAAIKLLSDEKKDTAALMLERSTRLEEIRNAAKAQVTDEPTRVRDRWRQEPGRWGYNPSRDDW